MLSLCCIFLSALYFVRSQNITTIPDTNTGDAYITVKEGEINETVVCIVFNPTIQLQSIWRIQRQGEDTMLMSIFFTSNGVPKWCNQSSASLPWKILHLNSVNNCRIRWWPLCYWRYDTWPSKYISHELHLLKLYNWVRYHSSSVWKRIQSRKKNIFLGISRLVKCTYVELTK